MDLFRAEVLSYVDFREGPLRNGSKVDELSYCGGLPKWKYKHSEKGKINNHKNSKKYRQTEKGRLTDRRYNHSLKGKAAHARYIHSPKGKASQARFYANFGGLKEYNRLWYLSNKLAEGVWAK